jgi:hypothetical protein
MTDSQIHEASFRPPSLDHPFGSHLTPYELYLLQNRHELDRAIQELEARVVELEGLAATFSLATQVFWQWLGSVIYENQQSQTGEPPIIDPSCVILHQLHSLPAEVCSLEFHRSSDA